MRLNKSQEKAANTLEGDLLIIASAGTGKTTTIIERYVNLIKNIGIQPNEIMMTTFTNKAAKDMISKIKKRTKSISPFIGTMHSIFLKILREHKDLIFEGYDFTLLTDNQDKTQIIREILKQESIDSERNAVNYFSGWIGKYKSRAIFSKDLSISSGIDELREKFESLKRSLNGKSIEEYKQFKSDFLQKNIFNS
jgi:DNA helicase-2/ATP-dependent DNA helicase PcrA